MVEIDIQTSYGKMHLYKKGCGSKPILLLHGIGSDSAMLSWREVLNSFGKECTVYAPDLLGYGKSDDYEGIAGAYFYEIHVDAIRQLTKQLDLHNLGPAGLSMGGAIAIGYALRYPEQVKYLLPVGSWGAEPSDAAA